MDLRAQILKDHSKTNCDKIVRWIGSSQQRFDELFRLFLHDEYRVVQRAAWPLSYSVIHNPSFIKPHFGRLIKNLQKKGIHDSVKRNTVRLLQHVEIPARYQGAVMDICFRYIASPDEPVAVKAFSLHILGNMAVQYPEIIPEVKLLIEEYYEHSTPAFKSSARKFLGK